MRKRNFTLFFSLLACIATSSLQAQQVFKTTSTSVIGYLEYVPQGYHANSDKYPIVIFLHGVGERGANSTDPAVLNTTIQNVAKLGPPRYVKDGHQFPFILISPQLKNNYGSWPAFYVMEVINHVKKYLRVDERRIYLTGLSLGGGGVWTTAQEFPGFFAAIAPVCGGVYSSSKACNIASENMPVWAFHGDADTVVPVSTSISMVNNINACLPAPSPLAKLTIYAGVAHDAWNNAYRNDNTVHTPNVYQWLTGYLNTRNQGNNIPVANTGADISATMAPSITISGSAADNDGTISSYQWKQLDGPSTATLANQNTNTLTVSGLAEGVYVFSMQVVDNTGNTDTDYVRVTVTQPVAPPNSLPVANSGEDKAIELPASTVSFTGTGSDSDGTITGYSWTKISGGNVVLGGASTQTLEVSSLVAGSYTFRLTVTDNEGAQASDDVNLTVLPENIIPAANAGSDVTIELPVNSITLTGSGTDTDGTITTYEWTKISGPAATLSGAGTASLVAAGLTNGSYVFRLTVTDNRGGRASDDVTVQVLLPNVEPAANAGSDVTIVLPVNSISLTGSGTDTDGTITTYEWTKISGPAATLSGASTASLVAADLTNGSYIFRLTVTDNRSGRASDDVTVNVLLPNVEPVANAGADMTVVLPAASVTLAGSGTDTDGTIVKYVWTKVSGNAVTFSNLNTANTVVSNLTEGTYGFRLTVTDDRGGSKSDDVTVTVLPPNIAPTANAGPDKLITLPLNSITIAGVASDPDGTIVAYAWTKVSGPAAVLSGITSANLSASGLTGGTYVFKFTVTDNRGGQKSDDMTLTVNIPPVANAGSDKSITLPINYVTLSGSGSDPDGTIVSYRWTKLSAGYATLSGATTPTLMVSDLVAGSYYFQLTVTDNRGATHFDKMLVTVKTAMVTSPVSSSTMQAVQDTPEFNHTPEFNRAKELRDLFGRGHNAKLLDAIDSEILTNATLLVFNESGERIYAGKWNENSYSETFRNHGLYIYHVVIAGKKVAMGKIFIR